MPCLVCPEQRARSRLLLCALYPHVCCASACPSRAGGLPPRCSHAPPPPLAFRPLQLAVLFPSTYGRWREPLAVWSHLIHKLAQTAVTLMPPVGTIFSGALARSGRSAACCSALVFALLAAAPRPALAASSRRPLSPTRALLLLLPRPALAAPLPIPTAATYNPTVALLESSSLAQVHMLSFGMKLRFSTHVAVNLFHFAAAVATNDQICAAGFPFLPGGACNALMFVWQALACFVLPCALVCTSEKRSRRIFLETIAD